MSNPKYVIMEGVLPENMGDRFFTTNSENSDPTVLTDGRIAYKILGYVNTVEQAQIFLYGRVC